MIDFSKRVASSKTFLVKVDSGLSDAKKKLIPQILNHRLSTKDPLRNIHRVIVFETLKWASTDCV